MKLLTQYALLVLSGLMTVSSAASVSVGLNQTTHIFTEEHVLEPNGLNHVFIGGKYPIKEGFSISLGFEHSITSKDLGIFFDTGAIETRLSQVKRYGFELGAAYELTPTLDVFSTLAIFTHDQEKVVIANNAKTTVSETEQRIQFGISADIYSTNDLTFVARPSIGISSATSELADSQTLISNSFNCLVEYHFKTS